MRTLHAIQAAVTLALIVAVVYLWRGHTAQAAKIEALERAELQRAIDDTAEQIDALGKLADKAGE